MTRYDHVREALLECADGEGSRYRGEIFTALRWLAGCTCARLRGSDAAVTAEPDPNQVRAVEGAPHD